MESLTCSIDASHYGEQNLLATRHLPQTLHSASSLILSNRFHRLYADSLNMHRVTNACRVGSRSQDALHIQTTKVIT